MDNKNEKYGIITKGTGGLYRVRLASSEGTGEYADCRARGRFRHDGMSPLVGDDVVVISDLDSAEPVIDDILPRYSSLLRPPMANLTHLFLLIPSCRPKPDLLTADKITAIACHAGIETVIVAGKADMDKDSAENIKNIYTLAGYNAFSVSAVTGEGTDELLDYVSRAAEEGELNNRPMRAAFVGVSGAGKSTLMSALFPQLSLTTGGLSRKTERGRHTTRTVELYPLETSSGAFFYLADTPGFSMLDFTRYNFFAADELAGNFREFAACLGECRYTKCTHTKEEGCAVLEKLRRGEIHKSRHDGFCQIYAELKQKPEWKRLREAEALPPKKRPR